MFSAMMCCAGRTVVGGGDFLGGGIWNCGGGGR